MPKETAVFELKEIRQSHDSKQLKKGIEHLPGVISVSINIEEGKVAVDYDNTGVSGAAIAERIGQLGFHPHVVDKDEHLM